MHNVVILIKSVFFKKINYFYYKMLSEKCSYISDRGFNFHSLLCNVMMYHWCLLTVLPTLPVLPVLIMAIDLILNIDGVLIVSKSEAVNLLQNTGLNEKSGT